MGKLNLVRGFDGVFDYLKNNSIEILPLNFLHTVENNKLSFHHRNLFDRIIVAYALVENVNLLMPSAAFDDYLEEKSIKRIY